MPARMEDITPRPSKAVLISHEVWQTEFEGRTEVIGRPVGLAAGIYTVVGVLPPRFTFNGERPDFLLPIGIMQHNSQYTDLIHAIARLSSGVSLDTASGIAEPIAAPLATSPPPPLSSPNAPRAGAPGSAVTAEVPAFSAASDAGAASPPVFLQPNIEDAINRANRDLRSIWVGASGWKSNASPTRSRCTIT